MMKPSLFQWITGSVLVAVGTVLVFTNPDPTAYERYAGRYLSQYVRENYCPNAPTFFAFIRPCEVVVNALEPTIRDIFAHHTKRQNWLFFSLYITDISSSSLITLGSQPEFFAYHTETLSILNQFHTYKIEQR